MKAERYNTYQIIMEYAWLTIAVTSLVTAIVNIYYAGFDKESIKFGVLFILTFAMYLYRRHRRKSTKNNQIKGQN
jgi:hypothetical protein